MSGPTLTILWIVYIAAPDRAPVGSFYFVENGEGSFAEIAQAIAHSLGQSKKRRGVRIHPRRLYLRLERPGQSQARRDRTGLATAALPTSRSRTAEKDCGRRAGGGGWPLIRRAIAGAGHVDYGTAGIALASRQG